MASYMELCMAMTTVFPMEICCIIAVLVTIILRGQTDILGYAK